MARFNDGSRHVTHVTEVLGMEGDVIVLQDLFVYEHGSDDPADGADSRTPGGPGLRPTGLRPHFLDKMVVAGVRVDPAVFGSDAFRR